MTFCGLTVTGDVSLPSHVRNSDGPKYEEEFSVLNL
jgi:hypothetical protein